MPRHTFETFKDLGLQGTTFKPRVPPVWGETRSRPTRAHTSGMNMPSWPLPEQVDVRIVPEARTHEAAYASEQQPHRRAPPTGCAHPVASKQLPSRTP